MSFGALPFLAFFLVVLALHRSLRGDRLRKDLLLVASYVFYAAWDWRFLGLIAGSTLVDYLCGLGIARATDHGRRRALLLTSLTVNLGVLCLYKYFDFFAESTTALLGALGVDVGAHTLHLVLPVGISFYTFQTLSYTIGVYRGEDTVCRDLRDFALFVAFFPQLVAGPIVRAGDFLPQLRETRERVPIRHLPLLFLFLAGYVKKYCIADNVAPFVDPVFADPGVHTSGALWLSAAGYYVQIYCDFSGYSDMAIATAGLLGYRLPINFSFPMFATSVTSAWRRWHISLSSWFRDYLYIPLGGNRRGKVRTAINLWTVFLLCGLWHGAAWTYVVWGAVHGLFLVLERSTPLRRWFESSPLGLVPTQLVFTCAFVVFRAPDLGSAGTFLAGMFGSAASTTPASSEDLALLAPILVLFLAGHVLSYLRLGVDRFAALPRWAQAGVLGSACSLALAFSSASYQPFIYFQF